IDPSLRYSLFAIKPHRVLPRKANQNQGPPSQSNRTSHIEQAILPAGKMYSRLPEQRQIAQCQQQPQFRRAKSPERQAKFSQGLGGKIGLNRKHEEADQQAGRDPGMYVARQRQATHERERPKAIDHVVDIKSIAWTLPPPHPRERSVERVAEPVQR